MDRKHFIKRADMFLIISLVLIAAILFLPRIFDSSSKKAAIVYKNGEIVYDIDLNSVNKSYKIDLHTDPQNILLVEKGQIRYYKSTCPDKLCVKSGWLSDVSDTAACVPAKTVVVIKGNQNTDKPDVIS